MRKAVGRQKKSKDLQLEWTKSVQVGMVRLHASGLVRAETPGCTRLLIPQAVQTAVAGRILANAFNNDVVGITAEFGVA